MQNALKESGILLLLRMQLGDVTVALCDNRLDVGISEDFVAYWHSMNIAK
jgi:hypothetical protein